VANRDSVEQSQSRFTIGSRCLCPLLLRGNRTIPESAGEVNDGSREALGVGGGFVHSCALSVASFKPAIIGAPDRRRSRPGVFHDDHQFFVPSSPQLTLTPPVTCTSAH